jgi:hypothetical protein
MSKVLRRSVMSEMAVRRFAWTAGFVVLASYTALVLKALPGFGLAASIGLVSIIALAWAVIGSHLPKVVRP